MIVVGVDPGITGAFAVLTDASVDGGSAAVHDMPVHGKFVDGRAVAALLSTVGNALVVIEDVHAMPINGSIGSFSLGRSKGIVEGVIAALGLRCEYVSPQRWKKEMRLSKDKGASRRMAADLYPDLSQTFARVKDDGRAEALLIAHWYRKANR